MYSKSQFVRVGLVIVILTFTARNALPDWLITTPVGYDSWSADNYHDSQGTYGTNPTPYQIRLELRASDDTLVSSCQGVKDGVNENWSANTQDHRLLTDSDFLGTNTVIVQGNTQSDPVYVSREYEYVTVTNGSGM